MADQMRGLLESWEGSGVLVSRDAPTGSWIFVALHELTLGPAVGGCRMKRYDRPEDGLLDAMRLAEGMTYKWAAIDFPFGGGKSVLAVPRALEGEERDGLLIRFGGLLENLRGTYSTGVDLGTTPEDMAVVARVTRNVMGLVDGVSVDPGPYTARGVFEAIQAALDHHLGDPALAGRRALVQGVGDVGLPLARMLAEAGAELLVADVDAERTGRVADALDARAVEASRALETECDVLAPCAVGGVLDRDTIPTLRCRVVAGSANNQLGTPEDADRLHERGILYAPDYVANAGGAIAFGRFHLGVRNEETVLAEVATIRKTLREIFLEAEARGEPPAATAHRRAHTVLRRAREKRSAEIPAPTGATGGAFS